ncbi:flavin reductase family protein [Rossellomorea yichunensis]|uniref:flavin reductase family protein n=1 Tax=Rossellomorea yichunensis TaxID=3077331 RepID=UPI0028DE8E68|nr:flavin reductase family protein [Rossellomorea sp. YC4-1]MDT9026043.1 flavin reductase family protein [Rossellomorea sp. YC4-1]
MDIKPQTLEWQSAYKLMIGSILPRPIAFVSSLDEDGIANLAPYSFFTAICAEPMLVCFSPMRRGKDGSKKDTLRNIEKTKEFVINIVSEEFVEKMNNCAIEFEPGVDEFEQVGLAKKESITVKPPGVSESKVQLECVLHEVLHFGDHPGAGSLVIGKVECVRINDELYYDGKIDSEKLKPVGRLAGQMYTKPLSDSFELIRKR